MLTGLLFTVGLGLLLMGAQAGHQVFFAESGWGWDDEVVSLDGVQVDAGDMVDGTVMDGGKLFAGKVALNAGGVKVFHSEGHAVQSHKIYKRIRGRSGPDFFYSTFSISYYHPQMVPLPEMYGASIHRAIRVTFFLRGPPSA